MNPAIGKVRMRLTNVLRRSSAKTGAIPSAAADSMISKMIVNGVQRMSVAQALEQEDKIHLAENNLRRLLRFASDKASTAGTFPIIEEPALSAAQKTLCPLWPYC